MPATQTWPEPELCHRDDSEARPGYTSMKRHEYRDCDSVLDEKISFLASKLREATHAVVYAGAGLSTSAGISDYASSRGGGTTSPLLAQPTIAHRLLVAMSLRGLFAGGWIQQNHDGLPQKAGLPQSHINEIHGAWFDPSNPVVKMSGNLRDDLFKQLLETESQADLVLAVGTSMSGMNADRVAVSCAERATRGKGHGLVIISLQRTQHTKDAQLHIFADIDTVINCLASKLDITATPLLPQPSLANFVLRVPYDEDGKLYSGDSRRILDISQGAEVCITGGPHKGEIAEIIGQDRHGHIDLRIPVKLNGKGNFKAKVPAKLGTWWISAATAGTVPLIPIVTLPKN